MGGSTNAPTIFDHDVRASFVGSYGNGDYDGTYDQDFDGGVVVGPSRTITMFGNAWKAYELETPFNVTVNSKLQFDFWMISEAEGHAICVDNDINEDTFGGERIRCFMLGGTQFDDWDHVIKIDVTDSSQIRPGQVPNRYSLCESEKLITIDLKDLFLDQLFQIRYIAFIQDNDASPNYGESAFENIKLYNADVDVLDQFVRFILLYFFHYEGANSQKLFVSCDMTSLTCTASFFFSRPFHGWGSSMPPASTVFKVAQ